MLLVKPSDSELHDDTNHSVVHAGVVSIKWRWISVTHFASPGMSLDAPGAGEINVKICEYFMKLIG